MNNHLVHQIFATQKRPWHMTLEIQILVLDRNKNVVNGSYYYLEMSSFFYFIQRHIFHIFWANEFMLMYTVRNYLSVSEYCKLSNLYTSTQIYVIFILKHKFKWILQTIQFYTMPDLHWQKSTKLRSPLW
jgi:hypothetical protein